MSILKDREELAEKLWVWVKSKDPNETWVDCTFNRKQEFRELADFVLIERKIICQELIKWEDSHKTPPAKYSLYASSAALAIRFCLEKMGY